MVERTDRAAIATFFAADGPLVAGATLTLGESVAKHVRALRLGTGHEIILVDGAGTRADATIVRTAKDSIAAQVRAVEEVAPLPDVHLLVPVADRDRMLWLAEKAAELGATSWRPVMWRRSKSVAPRGEGTAFAQRVRARMVGGLEQSGGAHLPTAFPEATPERAIAAAPAGARIVLDPEGPPLLSLTLRAPVVLALGPEGGLERQELEELAAAGFQPASIATGILRFETAGIAALAAVRASLHAAPGGSESVS